jgi:hypothetical protein
LPHGEDALRLNASVPTGSTSLDHCVAFIDGYAGPGRYEDGEEGPGAMLLRKAKEMAHFPRQVECLLWAQSPRQGRTCGYPRARSQRSRRQLGCVTRGRIW